MTAVEWALLATVTVLAVVVVGGMTWAVRILRQLTGQALVPAASTSETSAAESAGSTARVTALAEREQRLAERSGRRNRNGTGWRSGSRKSPPPRRTSPAAERPSPPARPR